MLYQIAADVLRRIGSIFRCLHVEGWRSSSQFNGSHILFRVSLQFVNELSAIAGADDEHPRSQRVECASMSHLELFHS